MLQPTRSKNRYFPDVDRLSILMAVVMLGFVASQLVQLPTRTVQTSLLGSSIGIDINGETILAILVALLVGSGSDAMFRRHPELQGKPIGTRTFLHWVLPSTASLGLVSLINQTPPGPLLWIELILAAVFLTLILVAEYITLYPRDANYHTARTGLTILSYLVMISLYGWLHYTGARAAINATAALLTTFLISLRLFRLNHISGANGIWGALVVALLLGQAMWALNYWFIPSIGAGLVLLCLFYIIYGVVLQQTKSALNTRFMLEYLVVGGIALLISLQFAFRRLP
jgi:hypothetical protein